MNFIDVLPFLCIPGRALSLIPYLQTHHVAVRFWVSSQPLILRNTEFATRATPNAPLSEHQYTTDL